MSFPQSGNISVEHQGHMIGLLQYWNRLWSCCCCELWMRCFPPLFFLFFWIATRMATKLCCASWDCFGVWNSVGRDLCCLTAAGGLFNWCSFPPKKWWDFDPFPYVKRMRTPSFHIISLFQWGISLCQQPSRYTIDVYSWGCFKWRRWASQAKDLGRRDVTKQMDHLSPSASDHTVIHSNTVIVKLIKLIHQESQVIHIVIHIVIHTLFYINCSSS